MSRIQRVVAISALLAIISFFASFANAQKKELAPPAPVPSQIFTAKRVFISNAGLDGYSYQGFQKLGDLNQPYNAFYAAVNSWRKYMLVSTPVEADLVFEIRFLAPDYSTTSTTAPGSPQIRLEPLLTLTIYDSKTRFVLWTIQEPVERAFLKGHFAKNVSQGVAGLIDDLKALYGDAVKSASAPAK